MKNKKQFSLILAVLLLIVSIYPAYAATTQEQLSDAKRRKESAQSTLEDTREKIADLETKKDQSETYLSELSQQLTELKESLEQLQADSEAKQTELLQVQQELEEAKQQEEKQYEDMKLRIQYMYENSGSGYIEVLFSSENFSDFLNRAENMAQISQYDRNMLDDYQAIKDQVQAKEEQVIAEQQEIARLQDESAVKQEQVQELYEATYDQIREYAEGIGSAQTEANSLLSQINSQEETITQLLIQAKNEEVERQEAAAREAAKKAAESAQKKPAQPSGTSSGSTAPDAGKGNGTSDGKDVQDSKPSDGGQSQNTQGTYLGRFKLTSYCSCPICCGKWSGGSTASGTTPTPGRTIAMAGLPFGTQLLINGHVYTVEDRGTQYGHVDVFTGSHSDALAFGVQYADVYRLN